MRTFRWVAALFEAPAAQRPYGEDVTIAAHMLQTAAAAAAAGSSDALTVAALLHDVGHFLDHPENDDLGNRHHAHHGATMLASRFPPAVTEPIRLHVAAKRFLVATEAGYAATLSAASVRTLAQQGGRFSVDQVEEFLAEPHASSAIALRRFDDDGKQPGADVPGLDDHRQRIERCAS